jgi:uncharacterized phage protein gp47/JayE
MAITTPTYQEIYNKQANELTIQINTNQTDTSKHINTLQENFLVGLNAGLSLSIADLYTIAKFSIFNNLFPQTADETYALIWGVIFGVIRKTATKASGNVAFTGTAGGSVPNGTVLTTATGLSYTTQATANITSQTINISSLTRSGFTVMATTSTAHNLASGVEVVIAGANETDYNGTFEIIVINATQFTYIITGTPTTPATGTITASLDYAFVNIIADDFGADYNLANGGIIDLSSSIANVDDTARVLYEGITGGQDQETINSVKLRTQERTANRVTAFAKKGIEFFVLDNFNFATRAWVFGAEAITKTVSVSSLSSNTDGTATAILASSISFLEGTTITISGANETAFNITKKAVQTANNKIVYCLDTASNLTATGTITMQYTEVPAGFTKIYFVKDNEANIIPTASNLISVKNAIVGNTAGIDGILPAPMPEANCQVLAPAKVDVDITFSALSPNTLDMQTAITSSLENYFSSTSVNLAEDVLLDNIKGVISNTIDNNGNTPSFTLSSPSVNVSVDSGELAVLNSITYP